MKEIDLKKSVYELTEAATFDPEMESLVTLEIADYLKQHGARNRD